MLSRSNALILGLAVLAAVAGGYVQRHAQSKVGSVGGPEPTMIGQPLPDIALRDLDGRMHRLTGYRGRRLLLNFWASWCGPCLQEMPALGQAQAKFGERGPIVIGIAMDEPARVRPFLTAHPLTYPILLGRLAAPSTSLQLGDIREGLPYSVLVDASGQILATHAGALSPAQIEQWLAEPVRP
jgi:peroxiredoxin